MYEELSDFLLQMVQEQSLNLTNKTQKISQEDQVITVRTPNFAPLFSSNYESDGLSTTPSFNSESVFLARPKYLEIAI